MLDKLKGFKIEVFPVNYLLLVDIKKEEETWPNILVHFC